MVFYMENHNTLLVQFFGLITRADIYTTNFLKVVGEERARIMFFIGGVRRLGALSTVRVGFL